MLESLGTSKKPRKQFVIDQFSVEALTEHLNPVDVLPAKGEKIDAVHFLIDHGAA